MLTGVTRNRMLKQRETMWSNERQAATDAINALDNDVDYRMAMNIMSNYICMTFILWSKEDNGKYKQFMYDSFQKEKGLKIWGESQKNMETIELWLERGKFWSCEGCSELLRLLVGVIEGLQDNVPTTLPLPFLKAKSDHYNFTCKERFKSEYILEQHDLYVFSAMIWELKNKKVNNVSIFEKTKSDSMIDPKGPRSRESIIDILKRITGLKKTDLSSKRRIARLMANSSGGTNIHSLKPNSLVGTLEWIFGLPCGADTSGTTAEIIGICETIKTKYLPEEELNSLIKGVPLFLGPALSMVKNGHHTLIECAVPMCMGFEDIKYAPGFYSTILPAGGNTELYRKVKEAMGKHDLKDSSKVATYLPSKDAWSKDDQNQVSLRGGTIMNSYQYIDQTGAKFKKVNLLNLLKEITNVQVINKDFDTQITNINECVITMIK